MRVGVGDRRGRAASLPPGADDARRRADATAAVAACLSPDLPYEARAAAMKALRDAGAAKVAAATNAGALRRRVARDALPAETRHSCARRALRLMEDWDAFADADDAEADDAEWATVSKLASASANERVRCAALRCLGRAARRRAAKIDGTTRTSASSNPDPDPDRDRDRAVAEMSSLVALVRAGASPERPEDTRRAAASALASSGALERLPPPFAAADPEAINPGPATGEACLAAWLAAFELMEDEDEDVREIAAAAAAKAAGVASDTKTEEILRRSFRRVAARLARWPPYERYLARAAGAPVKAQTLVAAIAEMCVVRRLFDREADNHHAEALLVSQLAAEAARGRPRREEIDDARGGTEPATEADADGDGDAITSSAMRPSAARAALDAAIGSAEEVAAALSSAEAEAATSDWAGGATNHEAAFAPACRAALATWALAGAAGAEARARVRARVAAVDETFARVELGPTAAAMWRAASEAVGVASKVERKRETRTRNSTRVFSSGDAPRGRSSGGDTAAATRGKGSERGAREGRANSPVGRR